MSNRKHLDSIILFFSTRVVMALKYYHSGKKLIEIRNHLFSVVLVEHQLWKMRDVTGFGLDGVYLSSKFSHRYLWMQHHEPKNAIEFPRWITSLQGIYRCLKIMKGTLNLLVKIWKAHEEHISPNGLAMTLKGSIQGTIIHICTPQASNFNIILHIYHIMYISRSPQLLAIAWSCFWRYYGFFYLERERVWIFYWQFGSSTWCSIS